MTGGIVIPNNGLLTDSEYRTLVAAGVRRASAKNGVARLGLQVGADERTLRNARDGKSSLCGSTLVNLLAADPHALDELLAHFGVKLVPIDASGDSDADLNADVAALNAEVACAMRDGKIDRIENARILAKARPVVRELAGRIAAADRVAA